MPIPLAVLLARLSHVLESARIVATFGPDDTSTREELVRLLDKAQTQLSTVQEVAP